MTEDRSSPFYRKQRELTYNSQGRVGSPKLADSLFLNSHTPASTSTEGGLPPDTLSTSSPRSSYSHAQSRGASPDSRESIYSGAFDFEQPTPPHRAIPTSMQLATQRNALSRIAKRVAEEELHGYTLVTLGSLHYIQSHSAHQHITE